VFASARFLDGQPTIRYLPTLLIVVCMGMVTAMVPKVLYLVAPSFSCAVYAVSKWVLS
jgi:hypothetical protein